MIPYMIDFPMCIDILCFIPWIIELQVFKDCVEIFFPVFLHIVQDSLLRKLYNILVRKAGCSKDVLISARLDVPHEAFLKSKSKNVFTIFH